MDDKQQFDLSKFAEFNRRFDEAFVKIEKEAGIGEEELEIENEEGKTKTIIVSEFWKEIIAVAEEEKPTAHDCHPINEDTTRASEEINKPIQETLKHTLLELEEEIKKTIAAEQIDTNEVLEQTDKINQSNNRLYKIYNQRKLLSKKRMEVRRTYRRYLSPINEKTWMDNMLSTNADKKSTPNRRTTVMDKDDDNASSADNTASETRYIHSSSSQNDKKELKAGNGVLNKTSVINNVKIEKETIRRPFVRIEKNEKGRMVVIYHNAKINKPVSQRDQAKNKCDSTQKNVKNIPLTSNEIHSSSLNNSSKEKSVNNLTNEKHNRTHYLKRYKDGRMVVIKNTGKTTERDMPTFKETKNVSETRYIHSSSSQNDKTKVKAGNGADKESTPKNRTTSGDKKSTPNRRTTVMDKDDDNASLISSSADNTASETQYIHSSSSQNDKKELKAGNGVLNKTSVINNVKIEKETIKRPFVRIEKNEKGRMVVKYYNDKINKPVSQRDQAKNKCDSTQNNVKNIPLTPNEIHSSSLNNSSKEKSVNNLTNEEHNGTHYLKRYRDGRMVVIKDTDKTTERDMPTFKETKNVSETRYIHSSSSQNDKTKVKAGNGADKESTPKSRTTSADKESTPDSRTTVMEKDDNNASSAGFGSNTQVGTVIKFTPVTGTDIMVKGRVKQTISTRQHCITCMEEYENKSLEELRWEDYQVDRKGLPQDPPAGGLFRNMSEPVWSPLFRNRALVDYQFHEQQKKPVSAKPATATEKNICEPSYFLLKDNNGDMVLIQKIIKSQTKQINWMERIQEQKDVWHELLNEGVDKQQVLYKKRARLEKEIVKIRRNKVIKRKRIQLTKKDNQRKSDVADVDTLAISEKNIMLNRNFRKSKLVAIKKIVQYKYYKEQALEIIETIKSETGVSLGTIEMKNDKKQQRGVKQSGRQIWYISSFIKEPLILISPAEISIKNHMKNDNVQQRQVKQSVSSADTPKSRTTSADKKSTPNRRTTVMDKDDDNASLISSSADNTASETRYIHSSSSQNDKKEVKAGNGVLNKTSVINNVRIGKTTERDMPTFKETKNVTQTENKSNDNTENKNKRKRRNRRTKNKNV